VNWALVFIAVAANGLFAREVFVIRRSKKLRDKEAAWPQFEETYISALQSGISVSESFSFAADFETPAVSADLAQVISDLDRGIPLKKALDLFRNRVGLSHADLFVSIVALAHDQGGQSLVAALSEHVEAVRFELVAKGDVLARQNAILTVAKLGLLAPWVLVAVLSVNEQTRNSFNSFAGNSLLIGGFAISFLAFRLVVAAGKPTLLPRVFWGADV
jgi:tight adherence protein B